MAKAEVVLIARIWPRLNSSRRFPRLLIGLIRISNHVSAFRRLSMRRFVASARPRWAYHTREGLGIYGTTADFVAIYDAQQRLRHHRSPLVGVSAILAATSWPRFPLLVAAVVKCCAGRRSRLGHVGLCHHAIAATQASTSGRARGASYSDATMPSGAAMICASSIMAHHNPAPMRLSSMSSSPRFRRHAASGQ